MSNRMKSFLNISLILLLGMLIFLPRLQVLPFHGEEPRRVICAFEMKSSKNWFVPTVQKEVFLSRPPLQNWIIAAFGALRGSFDHLTGRLPTVISLLLMAMLIYYYCLSALSQRTGLLAALFFLTMPQVLQFGLTAETELMFTLFLSGSFLLWHAADIRRWNPYLKWGIAYFFLGLATLTKGINQAPIYFGAIIGLYLIINHRLKELLWLPQIFGFFLFLLIVGSWQWGFVYYLGAKTGWLMHLGDVQLRFNGSGPKDYLVHALVFPLELLAVMLPWSLFLFAYARPTFWHQFSKPDTKVISLFCLGALGITICSVWYPPGAKTRYYMPLFPCVAILAAIAAESLWSKFDGSKKLWWAQYSIHLMKGMRVFIPMSGLLFFVWSMLGITFIQPPIPIKDALFYLMGCLLIGLILTMKRPAKETFGLYVISYALFAALTLNVIYMDTRQEKYNDVQSQVVSALEKLPKYSNLVSLGTIPSDFLYYYILGTGRTIPLISNQAQMIHPSYICSTYKESLNKLPVLERIMTIESGRYKRKYTHRTIEEIIIVKAS